MNEEIEFLREHIKDIYAYKSLQEELTYNISLDVLKRICIAFDYLQQENQQLKEDIKAYEQERNNLINSIPFKQNKRLESKINKTKEAIDELLIFNDDNGITSGIGNVKEELKFYLSDYDTLEEFRKSEKGDNNEC